MRRRLLNFAALASLVLCAAAALLWLGSFSSFAPFAQSWVVSWNLNGNYLAQKNKMIAM